MENEITKLKEELEAKSRELNAIQESFAESALLIENINHALDESSLVALTTLEGDITYVNKQFLRVSQYSEEELYGENHRILKSGFHTPEFFAKLWTTISSGEIWKGDIRNRAKDGSIYWVRSIIMPTYDKDRTMNGYVAIRTPVTDAMQDIEDDYRKEMSGEELPQERKDRLEDLKTGSHEIYDWIK